MASAANQPLFPTLPPVRRWQLHQPSPGPRAGSASATARLSPFCELQPIDPQHPRPRHARRADAEVRLGGAESARLHAGHHHVPRRPLLRDRRARGLGLPGARRPGRLPEPARLDLPVTGAICDPLAPPAGCGTCNAVFHGAPAVPNGMQWTGLTCNIPTGCTCPPDAARHLPRPAYCSAGGKIPYGYPLYTPIWGVGQINMGGTARRGPATGDPCSPWSANSYIATWPSISIRATQGHAGDREVGERVPQQPRPLPAPRGGRLALRHRPHLHGREGPPRSGHRRQPAHRRAPAWREPVRQPAAAGQLLGDPPARRRDPALDRRLRREVVRERGDRRDLQRRAPSRAT